MQAKPRLLDAVLLVAAIAALPIKTAGCGHTACITVTADMIAQNGGMCPSSDIALSRFMDRNCPNTDITAIDGPGTLDGELCCYPVEQNTGGPQVFCGGFGEGGFTSGQGGSTTFVSTSSGFAGGETATGGCGGCGCGSGGCGVGGSSFGGSSTVTGFGGTGGDFDAGCESCGAWLNGAGSFNFCANAQSAQTALVACACSGSGAPCPGSCGTDLCMGQTPSSGCLSCVMSSTCSTQLTICEGN